MSVKHPLMLWAQRSSHIYLTLEVKDMKISEMSANGNKFKFRGIKEAEEYEADLELYGDLKGDELRQTVGDCRIELIIPKESTEWWPRLLKNQTKIPWIKVDFEKWKDENEENDEESDANSFFQQLYRNADDNTKKAMMKSYSESCGTVLSTNWEDIKKKKTEVSPPDGMEHKKFDQ
ncbi:SGS domain-containing protein [Ditylenchus destructor]|nr:SGS domain-containing protein [Ditylenchus destructor]